MKTKFKKISDARVEITVTLDAKDLKKAEKTAIERLAKEVRVEGFRKGKAPTDIAKKFIPENDLNAEVIDIAIRTSVVPAFREHEKMPLVAPNVNVTKYVPGEMAEYTATADIVPEVKLGDYKKLKVKPEKVSITDTQVKEVLDNLTSSFAEKKPVKRAAKLTDEVIIDFVGKKGGEAFAGGSAKDYKLVLGSKTFIPGFEEGIVGHESGDKFDLKLTFPKDYGVKDLAGAKVVFETLLKQVNEVTKPKIDDDLAKKCGPFKTLKELKEDIKKNLKLQEEHRAEEKFKDALIAELVKVSKIPVPEILMEDQLKLIKEDMTRNAASRGISSLEEFIEKSGETMENWEKEARKVAESRVKASMALQNLAIKEKITVSDEEVSAKLAELREIYKKSEEAVKSLKDPNVKMDIKNRMTLEKTLDYLVKVNS
ncbi:MAG: trigger factor [Candidatus Saccharibacteria bacterium]|nr:trigger factor [Candidatus Saccharibacteria bacterium]